MHPGIVFAVDVSLIPDERIGQHILAAVFHIGDQLVEHILEAGHPRGRRFEGAVDCRVLEIEDHIPGLSVHGGGRAVRRYRELAVFRFIYPDFSGRGGEPFPGGHENGGYIVRQREEHIALRQHFAGVAVFVAAAIADVEGCKVRGGILDDHVAGTHCVIRVIEFQKIDRGSLGEAQPDGETVAAFFARFQIGLAVAALAHRFADRCEAAVAQIGIRQDAEDFLGGLLSFGQERILPAECEQGLFFGHSPGCDAQRIGFAGSAFPAGGFGEVELFALAEPVRGLP